MAAYPEYRESGVAWIGAVPVGWRVMALKHFVSMASGDQITSEQIEEDGAFPVFGGNGLRGYTTGFTHDGHYALIGRQGALCGNINYAQGKFWASEHAVVVTPRQPCAVFWLGELLRSMNLGQYSVTAAQPGLSVEAVGNLRIPVPPQSEQSAIAAFLDRETGKIDALVAEQERLMALLKEKRQAVISQAVTKGLNPNAPMKESGVEWLGEVPAHWKSLQLGRVCTQVSDGPHFSPNYVDEGVLFLSARNIRVDGWSLVDAKYVSESDYEEFSRRVIPEIGDVLYTKGGTTGIARVVDLVEKFQVWVHVAVLKINQNSALPHYVAYALNSVGCYEQSQLHTRGATNQDLGLTRMIKIWMALPPISEQPDIVAFLDEKTSEIDILIQEAARAITLLKERRAALISAAVTGKIDVRGLVEREAAA